MTQWFAGLDATAARLNSPPVVASMVNGNVANSNLETVIGTFTVAAGQYPAAANQGFRWQLSGTCGGTASPTLTVRMRVVSTSGTIIGSGSNTVTSASGWFDFDGWMLFSAIGSGGAFTSRNVVDEAFGGAAGAPTASGTFVTNGTAWNTTIANPIYVTAQFSVANAANVAAGLSGNLYPL